MQDFPLYEKLLNSDSPTNFSSLQVSRTILEITDSEIKENILAFIYHYYCKTNPNASENNIIINGNFNTFKLPFNGNSDGNKSAIYNFDSFDPELQKVIKNYLWACAK